MIESLFSGTDQIYASLEVTNQTLVEVKHPGFRELCRQYSDLRRELAEEGLDREVLGYLGRFVFTNLAAPVPFDHGSSIKLLESFKSANSLIDQRLPHHASKVKDLIEAFSLLVGTDENPMAEKLFELFQKGDLSGDIGLVVYRQNLIPFLEDIVGNLVGLTGLSEDNFHLLSPGLVWRSHHLYERLVVFGQEWVLRDGEYILSAPRSNEIYRIGYPYLPFSKIIPTGFDPSNWPEKGWPYTGVSHGGGKGFGATRPGDKVPDDGQGATVLDDFVRPVDINGKGREARAQVLAEFDDLVSSQMVELEEGSGVWLALHTPGSEGYRRYDYLGLDYDGSPGVFDAPVPELAPGTFLLLRTSGAGGDYIELCADLRLGELAPRYRETQRTWKNLLARKLQDHDGDLQVLSAVLIDIGCKVATPNNIRNWLNPRNIGLGDKENFARLLEYLGIGDQVKIYWDRLNAIRSAHQNAGREIKTRLFQEIKRMSPEDLVNMGDKEFVLSEGDGGSLTAFRIRKVHGAVEEIPDSQTQNLFLLE